VLRAKGLLRESRVDDVVVVFFAGHGLLDARLDYYFATVDMDFRDPSKRGLAYESLEGLLEDLRARRKVLLLDTCHSGELDREDARGVAAPKLPEGTVKVRAHRGLEVDAAAGAGLPDPHRLLQGL